MSTPAAPIALTDAQVLALTEKFGMSRMDVELYMKVTECRDGLINISAKEEEENVPHRAMVRGIMMTRDRILCPGSRVPVAIEAKSVTAVGDSLVVVAVTGEEISFQYEKLHPFLAGVFLTMVHAPEEQKSFVATHAKAIDNTLSRWDVSSPTTFMQMLEETGFPSMDELIKLSRGEGFVLQVHVFHRDLAMVSRQDAVCYAAICSCSNSELEMRLRTEYNLTSDLSAWMPEPGIFWMPEFSGEEAAKFFTAGWFEASPAGTDPRLTSGEAIMVHTKSGVFKIISEAQAFRESIRGTDANMWHAFVSMIRLVADPQFMTELKMSALTQDEMEEMGSLVTLDADPSFKPEEPIEMKLSRLHTAFVFALSPSLQPRALSFLAQYQQKRVFIRNCLTAVEKEYYEKGGILDEIGSQYNRGYLTELVSKKAEIERINQLDAHYAKTGSQRAQGQREPHAKNADAARRCVDIIVTAVKSALADKDAARKAKRGFNLAYSITANIGSLLGKENGNSFFNILRFFGHNRVQ